MARQIDAWLPPDSEFATLYDVIRVYVEKDFIDDDSPNTALYEYCKQCPCIAKFLISHDNDGASAFVGPEGAVHIYQPNDEGIIVFFAFTTETQAREAFAQFIETFAQFIANPIMGSYGDEFTSFAHYVSWGPDLQPDLSEGTTLVEGGYEWDQLCFPTDACLRVNITVINRPVLERVIMAHAALYK